MKRMTRKGIHPNIFVNLLLWFWGGEFGAARDKWVKAWVQKHQQFTPWKMLFLFI
ncbi:hypothetical protein [Bacillus sp. M6-12]|uniref:hypothetical protein n=1 Tax=Bacillus sp. M6-12 TaxID=2054166 RepID=UPI0015E0C3F1|nr:hypothetical protein [Bacillus sp. M6-12]